MVRGDSVPSRTRTRLLWVGEVLLVGTAHKSKDTKLGLVRRFSSGFSSKGRRIFEIALDTFLGGTTFMVMNQQKKIVVRAVVTFSKRCGLLTKCTMP